MESEEVVEGLKGGAVYAEDVVVVVADDVVVVVADDVVVVVVEDVVVVVITAVCYNTQFLHIQNVTIKYHSLKGVSGVVPPGGTPGHGTVIIHKMAIIQYMFSHYLLGVDQAVPADQPAMS